MGKGDCENAGFCGSWCDLRMLLWLVSGQHCSSFPVGGLNSFRAQEDACLCWGDSGCSEEERKFKFSFEPF